MSEARRAHEAELRAALSYLATMAIGHDYADAMRVHDAEWLIEDTLFTPATPTDQPEEVRCGGEEESDV